MFQIKEQDEKPEEQSGDKQSTQQRAEGNVHNLKELRRRMDKQSEKLCF